MMASYSKEDYLCLTDEEKLDLYFEQTAALEKLNEELDIAQEGILELQKELTLKRHALEENEKLFNLAKELKGENEQLKAHLPETDTVRQELESLKKRLEDETALWQDRFLALEHEKLLILSEKDYLTQLIEEYEKEMEQLRQKAAAFVQDQMDRSKELEALKQEIVELHKRPAFSEEELLQLRDELEAARQQALQFKAALEISEQQRVQPDSRKESSLPDFDAQICLQKKEEENALLRAEVGKIKIMAIQSMKEAKELKTKYLTLLKTYEEINNHQKEQEEINLSLQSKLREATLLKNRFEQDNKAKEGQIAQLEGDYQKKFDFYEKELQESKQHLAKKVKESTLIQEKLEEIDHSYQDKIKKLISDYQDRIESFQVQIQKLTREKDTLESETFLQIQALLDPLLDTLKRRVKHPAGFTPGSRDQQQQSLITDWNFHNESGVYTE